MKAGDLVYVRDFAFEFVGPAIMAQVDGDTAMVYANSQRPYGPTRMRCVKSKSISLIATADEIKQRNKERT